MTTQTEALKPLTDGKWYWVRYEGLGKTYQAPALYKESAKAFYSVEFSGIPTHQVDVICEHKLAQQSNEHSENIAYIDMSQWPPVRFKQGALRVDIEHLDGQELYTHPPVPTAQAKKPSQTFIDYLKSQSIENIAKELIEMQQIIDAFEKTKEPEQEPVAITITGKLGNIYSFTGDYSLKKGDKVYTTPPQRTWVGLTDEETKEIQNSMVYGNHQFTKVIAAIENKLKEKNT